MENAVARAIRTVGGPTQASFVCRVSVNTIHVWRRDGFVRDARAAVLLAEASGVPIRALVGLEVMSDPGGRTRRKGRRGTPATYPVLTSRRVSMDRLPPAARHAA